MNKPRKSTGTLVSPMERATQRAARNRGLLLSSALLLVGISLWTRFVLAVPEDFSDVREHFKYGSIGSDVDNGIPYWIWRVLPHVCSEHVKSLGDGSSTGYEAFGFVSEAGYDRPIGFSKRRHSGIDFVGLNCAACHVATVRESTDVKPSLVLGMPANQLDLLAYFEFLFKCADDPKFTVANVLSYIDVQTKLSPVERAIYRQAVPRLREALLSRAGRLAPLSNERFRSGKGRIDTFNPYKAMVLNFPELDRASPGASDFPSVWNQSLRKNMQLHWDGNNTSLFERNISAAIGAGVTPESIDMPRVERIAAWLQDLPPPPNPVVKNAAHEVAAGKDLYAHECQSCHGQPEQRWQGGRAGTVEPLAKVGTDPMRLRSYTYEFVSNQWTIGADHAWRFRHFRKTNGYANMPLDGLWARAPYLHNGSVPTLRDLLARPSTEPEDVLRKRANELRAAGDTAIAESVGEARHRNERPLLFFRGDDLIDPDNVGFVADRAREGERKHALYDTTTDGRHNSGHLYGTWLAEAQKQQLLAYLKTL
jgi:mono/diheme cytochrome c family protein